MDAQIEARFKRLVESGAGQVLAEWLQGRLRDIDKELRSAPLTTVQQVQGRALEIDHILRQVTK